MSNIQIEILTYIKIRDGKIMDVHQDWYTSGDGMSLIERVTKSFSSSTIYDSPDKIKTLFNCNARHVAKCDLPGENNYNLYILY